MSESSILWALLAGLGAWCLRMQWWITQHHKSCHSEPAADLAALDQRVKGCEGECDRLAKNAHDDRNHLGRVSLWVEAMRERLKLGSQ